MADQKKRCPGPGGKRGGENHRKHHTPFGDDWSKRHPVTRWSLLDRCEEPPPAPRVKLFGSTPPSEQVRRAADQLFKGQLPSDTIEQLSDCLAKGDTIGALLRAKWIENDLARLFRRGSR